MTTHPPQRWTPPPVVPLEGQFAPNGYLDEPEQFEVGPGPEDPLPDGEGGVVVGLQDGRILRRDGVRRDRWVVLADTRGRPLGLEWLPDGDLVVCDAAVGLLRVPRDGGTPEVLVSHGQGRRRVASATTPRSSRDGTIWFTESTRCNPLDDSSATIAGAQRLGRLLRRDPDGTVSRSWAA